MSCLFGYCGVENTGLLGSMAGLLSHRPVKHWEMVQQKFPDGKVFALGHGKAPWSNSEQLAQDMQRKSTFGHSGVLFDPLPKASDVLAVFSKNPVNAIQQTDGAYALAGVSNGKCYLARDPGGVKTLYWTQQGNCLLFASEVKALFASPFVDRNIRHHALVEFLTFSYIPGERTMFEDIYELLPGSYLCFDPTSNQSPQVKRYFLPEAYESENALEKNAAANEADMATALKEQLDRAVTQCCSPGGRQLHTPAVFLSGGIDSSAVLALAQEAMPGERIKTYSIHFGEKYPNENAFITQMVNRYNTEHQWLHIQPKDFLKDLNRVIYCLDEPIGDPITVPNFLLAEAAARNGSGNLVLNGEGGDPCFGGPKNIPMVLASLYSQRKCRFYENNSFEYNYLVSYKKCFEDLEQMIEKDLYQSLNTEEWLIGLLEPYFSASKPKSFINRLMVANMRLKGAHLILPKVDKMTSANGVLALAPLFTRRIIEQSMRIHPHYKFKDRIEKYPLKRAIQHLVPNDIVTRPKCGMMVPVRYWFRKEMQRYTKRVLSNDNLQKLGWFNIEYVRWIQSCNRVDMGGLRTGLKLWMIITLMHWHESIAVNRPAYNRKPEFKQPFGNPSKI